MSIAPTTPLDGRATRAAALTSGTQEYAMTKITTRTIRVGNHDLAAQCFAVTAKRDVLAPDIAAMAEPEREEAWPLTPAQVAEVAATKLRDSGGRPDHRDDCIWALKAGTLDACATHYWLGARTDGERAARHANARRAAARGDLS